MYFWYIFQLKNSNFYHVITSNVDATNDSVWETKFEVVVKNPDFSVILVIFRGCYYKLVKIRGFWDTLVKYQPNLFFDKKFGGVSAPPIPMVATLFSLTHFPKRCSFVNRKSKLKTEHFGPKKYSFCTFGSKAVQFREKCLSSKSAVIAWSAAWVWARGAQFEKRRWSPAWGAQLVDRSNVWAAVSWAKRMGAVPPVKWFFETIRMVLSLWLKRNRSSWNAAHGAQLMESSSWNAAHGAQLMERRAWSAAHEALLMKRCVWSTAQWAQLLERSSYSAAHEAQLMELCSRSATHVSQCMGMHVSQYTETRYLSAEYLEQRVECLKNNGEH